MRSKIREKKKLQPCYYIINAVNSLRISGRYYNQIIKIPKEQKYTDGAVQRVMQIRKIIQKIVMVVLTRIIRIESATSVGSDRLYTDDQCKVRWWASKSGQ